MQASKEITAAWMELKERGDVKHLSKILGIEHSNVCTILKTGKGTVTQISCIQKFYRNRAKAVKAANKPIDQD